MRDLRALLQEARRLLDGNHGKIGVGDRIAICSAIDAALAEPAPEPTCWICADDLAKLRKTGEATVYELKQQFTIFPECEQFPLYAEPVPNGAAPSPASQDDARDVARYRLIRSDAKLAENDWRPRDRWVSAIHWHTAPGTIPSSEGINGEALDDACDAMIAAIERDGK
jgi:hypothetical protein